MNKILLLLFFGLISGNAIVSAQAIVPQKDGKYDLKSGDVTMTVDSQQGGKILSFRHKDTEIISRSRFPNSFGSTFWTSPQSDWHWPPVPEYDSMPYKAESDANTLVLTGEKSEKFGYRMKKEFTTDSDKNAFIITYTIINESDQTRRVAPWEITRIPNGGLIFFKADEVTPGYNMTGLPFEFTKKAAWYTLDEAKRNRKINADGEGWVAYCNEGLLFVKSFPDLEASEPAPSEAEIQVYVHGGKTYLEIEEQGAYTTLKPGEALEWTVRWFLEPTDHPAVPSKALLKQALKILK